MQETTFTYHDLIQATSAKHQGRLDASFFDSQLFTLALDSREVKPTSVFLPLIGERFDAHTFLEGIVAHHPQTPQLAFCQRSYYQAHTDILEALPSLGLLVVEATLDALQALANFHRNRCHALVVGLTGSSGKTTMKEYLRHCLGLYKNTQATLHNYNNDIGVAKTLLTIQPEMQVVIVEMGMRGLGQIRRLTRMARPDIGLLINVGPAHIEMLGSLEAIAEAKCELVEGVQSDLVSNGDDALLQARLNALDIRHLSHHRYTQDTAQQLTPLANGCYTFEVDGVPFESKLPGLHQVSNLLGVLAVGRCIGISTEDIAKAFASFVPQAGRFEAIELGGGHCLINDAYNANPASMQASLTALFQSALLKQGMKRFLVLGSMQELGEHSVSYHHALLEQIKAFPAEEIEGVALIGNVFQSLPSDALESTAFPIHYFEDVQAFEQILPTFVGRNPVQWFLKGSRSHALETCIPTLQHALAMKGHPQ